MKQKHTCMVTKILVRFYTAVKFNQKKDTGLTNNEN